MICLQKLHQKDDFIVGYGKFSRQTFMNDKIRVRFYEEKLLVLIRGF